MIPSQHPFRQARWLGTAALAAAFASLLFSRRSAQLLSPQVWDEDGTHVLVGLLTHGLASIADPVNGYLILVPKLISALSLSISFYHYPLVSTVVTWCVIVAVGVAIARSPTTLRAPAWCALSVFCVPTDPEVFGLPLYTFWWTTLLLLLTALWNDEGKGWGWRLAFIVLGGLSSPVVAMIVPVMVVRAFVSRNRHHEVAAAALAAAIACVQLVFVFRHGVGQAAPAPASLVLNTLPVLVGKFLLGSLGVATPKVLLWGAAALILAIPALHWRKGADRRTFWTLAYLLAGAIALTVSRVDPVILDTRVAGPRYFFLPFVLIGWLLVQSAAAAPGKPHGLLAMVLLAGAAINAVPGWSRPHGDLRWAENVRTCARFPSYSIPVHYDGNSALAWHFVLDGSTCADRLTRGLWPAPAGYARLPTAPHRILNPGTTPPGKETARLLSTTMTGASAMPGFRVVGSTDPETGEVRLRMTRGAQLRYRSGLSSAGQSVTIVGHEAAFSSHLPPAADWALLDFSNSGLPDEFVVRIADHGQGVSQWVAIAIREPAPQE